VSLRIEAVTATNVTDDQIRELMVSPGLTLRNTCLVAMGTHATEQVRQDARAWCAAQIQARREAACDHGLVEILSVNGVNLDGAIRVCAICGKKMEPR
jgi:hypothetical protein